MERGRALVPLLVQENEALRAVVAGVEERVRLLEGRRPLIMIENALVAGVAVKKRAREDSEYCFLLENNYPGSSTDPAGCLPTVYLMEYGVVCLAMERDAYLARLQKAEADALFEEAKKKDEINALQEQLREMARLRMENDRLNRDNGRLREERSRYEDELRNARKLKRENYVKLVNGRIRRKTGDLLEEALESGGASQATGDDILRRHREFFKGLDEEDRKQNGE